MDDRSPTLDIADWMLWLQITAIRKIEKNKKNKD